MSQELTVKFDGRERKVRVSDDFDKTNTKHLFHLEAQLLAADSQNKSGSIVDFLTKSFEAGIADPAGKSFDYAEDMRVSGQRAMKEGLARIGSGEVGGGVLNVIGGAASWLFSPISGPAKAFVGDPTKQGVEMGLEGMGVDPNIGVRDIPGVGEGLADRFGDYSLAQGVADTVQLGAESVNPAMFIRGLRSVPRPTTESMDASMANQAQYPVIKEPAVGQQAVEEGGEAFVPRASVPLTRDLVTNPELNAKVQKIREANPENNQRLYKDIGDALYESVVKGEVPLSSISRLTKDLDMEPVEFVKAWETSIREAGQSLNVLSQMARQMSKDSGLPPAVRAELEEMAKMIAKDKSITAPERFMNVLRKVENFRRGMMVSQVKTAMRNGMSSIGRISISAVDDAFQSVLGGGSWKEMYDSISSDFSALPGVRNKQALNDIFEANPATQERVLNQRINEVDTDALNRIGRAVNGLNIFQERAFRKYAFMARLEKLAKASGADLSQMKPDRIPDAWLKNATEHALDMTFASDGGRMAKQLTRAFDQIPILYTVANPFPRFQFGNALPFLAQYSPLGLMKAFSPSMAEDLASGSNKAFAKAASKGMIGTLLLGQAMDLRDQFGGAKYYELDIPNEDGTVTSYDARPFAPLSYYLMMAEVIDDLRNPDKISTLKPQDFVEFAIGMNRVEGTGLILADLMRADGVEESKDIIAKFGADWLGSFTTPIAQLRDVKDAVTGDNRVRDPRGDTVGQTLEGTTRRNIPFVDESLPIRRDPLKEGPVTRPDVFGMPGGIGSQLTGLSPKIKSPGQAEVDRLDIKYQVYAPATGLKELDRIASGYMGKFEGNITDFISSDKYTSAPDHMKKMMLEELLKKLKNNAIKLGQGALGITNPEALQQYMIDQKTTETQLDAYRKEGLLP